MQIVDNNMVLNDTYYTNFSKYTLIANNNTDINPIYYNDWVNNPGIIERTNLKVLKRTLRANGCPVHGNKPVLIQRVYSYYTQVKCAINIQRIFRGFIVRESEKMRGPAANDCSVCINDTEFYTMNPLKDIPRECLFSYRNQCGFVYGFNLFALMQMFKRDRRLVNPYNREDIPFDVLKRLFSIYKKTKILYPNQSDYMF